MTEYHFVDLPYTKMEMYIFTCNFEKYISVIIDIIIRLIATPYATSFS